MPERTILLNKTQDFERGFLHNLKIDGHCLTCTAPGPAVYISHLLDSREAGCVWRRVDMEGQVSETLLCAIEDTTMVVNGKRIGAEDFLLDPERTPEEKKSTLLPRAQRYDSARSAMCRNLTGRYMIVWTELNWRDGNSPELQSVKLFLETNNFLRYLPAVYHDNDFLYRYLALFEVLYLDIESRIENQPVRYDPALATPEALRFLASCVGWPEPELWPPERLRPALCRAGELCALRGTREGLSQVVALYTGQTPYIVEHFLWGGASGGARPPSLYSDCPFSFTVLLRGPVSEEEYSRIGRVIRSFSPSQASVRVVFLNRRFLLDGHSYLDINTALTGSNDAFSIFDAEAFADEESLLSLL